MITSEMMNYRKLLRTPEQINLHLVWNTLYRAPLASIEERPDGGEKLTAVGNSKIATISRRPVPVDSLDGTEIEDWLYETPEFFDIK
jgi:hypothetical protein